MAGQLAFSAEAVLALPDRVTDCEGTLERRAQVLCTFYPGLFVRTLARELERAAEEAKEQ
jgi:hypothetical protein